MRSTIQVSSLVAARSCTISSPARSADGQCTEPTPSPSRHARTPSMSPRWLPRLADLGPSCVEGDRSTSTSGPAPVGATWIGVTGTSHLCRHRVSPSGPAASTATTTVSTMPASRKRTVVPRSPIGDDVADDPRVRTPASRVSASRGDAVAVSSDATTVRCQSLRPRLGSPSRSNAIVTGVSVSMVVTSGPVTVRTRIRRIRAQPAAASANAATSTPVMIASTDGAPVSRAIAAEAAHAAMSAGLPGASPVGRVRAWGAPRPGGTGARSSEPDAAVVGPVVPLLGETPGRWRVGLVGTIVRSWVG